MHSKGKKEGEIRTKEGNSTSRHRGKKEKKGGILAAISLHPMGRGGKKKKKGEEEKPS